MSYPPQPAYGGSGYGAPPPAQYGGFPPQQPTYGGGYNMAPPGPVPGVYSPSATPAPVNPELMQWFRSVDQDNSGTISVPELNMALSSSGQRFSLATTEKLLKMFDKDNNGEISLNEFAELHQFIQTMQQGFRKRDTSNNGRLHGNEVRSALFEGGYSLSEETFQAVMRKFDRQRRGSLGFDDYVELSLYISKARSVFQFYDRQRTGQVTFNLDTFIAGSVSIL